MQLVRDALRSLRNSFGGHDPQHHTLDTLEQGVASLMDRLYDLETRHKQEKRVRGMFALSHTVGFAPDLHCPRILCSQISLFLCRPEANLQDIKHLTRIETPGLLLQVSIHPNP